MIMSFTSLDAGLMLESFFYSSAELFRINTSAHVVSSPLQDTPYDCGLITIFALLVSYHNAGSVKFSRCSCTPDHGRPM